jgi:hypothetical protein
MRAPSTGYKKRPESLIFRGLLGRFPSRVANAHVFRAKGRSRWSNSRLWDSDSCSRCFCFRRDALQCQPPMKFSTTFFRWTGLWRDSCFCSWWKARGSKAHFNIDDEAPTPRIKKSIQFSGGLALKSGILIRHWNICASSVSQVYQVPVLQTYIALKTYLSTAYSFVLEPRSPHSLSFCFHRKSFP